MRIYQNAYELMSEMGRNLYEMGLENKPKSYQNKNIDGNDDFITKELICEQYCLMDLPDEDSLFVFSHCKNWADAEFKERISNQRINPGEAWKLRPEVWEEFLVNGKFDYTYSERLSIVGVTYKGQRVNLIDAIINLLNDDPDTRKAIMPIYWGIDSKNLDGRRRIPCSMYYNFLLRTNAKGEKQLNISYHQRSSDFILHFGNDVYLAWCMMEYVAEKVGVKPGYLIHTIDSLHTYKRDWNKLKTSLQTYLK